MSDEVCFLITLLYGGCQLIRVALKVSSEKLTSDTIDYPMEPENREVFFDLLPDYLREGAVVIEITNTIDYVVVVR